MSQAHQLEAFEDKYCLEDASQWEYHDSTDPLIRYLRDRRLRLAIGLLQSRYGDKIWDWSVLVVCGGVGGEGTCLANAGFRNVTVSDYSRNALEVCRLRDDRLECVAADTEAMDFSDESYDLVLVQDGLHHLRRPVLGFNEMLRVARHAAVVIEPHTGAVAELLGREWEEEHDSVNYVFRWNHRLVKQATCSYLVREPQEIKTYRVWNHNTSAYRVAMLLGGKRLGVACTKTIYALLGTFFPWLGNNMVSIVLK